MSRMIMPCVNAMYRRSRGLTNKHNSSDANESIARAIKSSCDKTSATTGNFQYGGSHGRIILKRQKTKKLKHTIEDSIIIAPCHVSTKDLLSKILELFIVKLYSSPKYRYAALS